MASPLSQAVPPRLVHYSVHKSGSWPAASTRAHGPSAASLFGSSHQVDFTVILLRAAAKEALDEATLPWPAAGQCRRGVPASDRDSPQVAVGPPARPVTC